MPKSIKELFDSAPKNQSGAIDLTKAACIAEGSTHVLYRFPDAPYVIKVMKQNPNPQELAELEQKYAALYQCFDQDGKQRCIQEEHLSHQIALPGKAPQNAALSLVPYESCFKAEVKFDFKVEPVELDFYLMEKNQALLAKAHKALTHHNEDEIDFDLNDYKNIDGSIGTILQRLDDDPALKKVMMEFLDHYRDFYQETNIILDAMGCENILFFKDEQGDWQFKIGSVIKHDTGKYAQALFTTLHSGENVDLTQVINYTHAYLSPANIRAVNACAMKLGLQPVIDDVRIDPSDLLKISQELPVGERMLSYAEHGDFKQMELLLEQSKHELSFNLRDFWAYPKIARLYEDQKQSPEALESFLKTVSEFPVILPEKEDDAKRVNAAKKDIVDRKKDYDLKNIDPVHIAKHFKEEVQKTKSEHAPAPIAPESEQGYTPS